MVEARISALLPAGGGGTRLGLGDKGFLELAGKPLLHWVAEKARQVAGEVLVAVPGERLDEARALLPSGQRGMRCEDYWPGCSPGCRVASMSVP